MDLFNFLKRHWNDHKDDVFIVDSFSDTTFSYEDIMLKAQKITGALLKKGFVPGDRIAILMNNCIEFAQLYFAALYGGFVVVPINPLLGVELAQYIISDSGVKCLITNGDIDFANQLTAKIDTVLFKDIEKCAASDTALQEPFENICETNELIIVYTSGTTSKPKGVVHTYGSIFSNGIEFVRLMGLGKDNRFINYLPMAYLGGYYNLLLIPFISGGSVVLSAAFQASDILSFWKPVVKHKVNTLWLVPTIVALLLELDRGSEGVSYCRQNKMFALVGTAPLSARTRDEFEAKYGFSLHENYGLTETLFITAIIPDMKDRTGVGSVLPKVSVKILDNKGDLVKSGEEGEVYVKTFSLMQGYHGDNKDLKADDYWFPTGDIGKFTESGNLVISGRKKDLIIKGGINISPAYIEDILSRHSLVKDCCVIGVPHKVMGEEIVCVLCIKDDASFEDVETEIKRLIAEKLPSIYRPTHIFELPDFPVTPTGKIQKHKIKIWVQAEINKKNTIKKSAVYSKTKHSTSFFQPSHVVDSISQAMSIKYNNKVYDLESNGVDVIALSLGEAFFDIPLYKFDDLPFPQIYHYSHSRGILELREKIASYYLDQYEVEFDPKNEIVITAGSKVAIYMSLLAILNPGDEVLIYEPAWVSYPEQVKLCHGIPVMVPHDKTVFEFDDYITNRTKVIIINNPNNPTGKIYSVDELTYLTRLAERYGLFILSDEAYSDFLLDEKSFISLGNIDKDKKYSIICNSMSKNYGMSGWRIGYVIANEPLINQILKINQHLITCPATILEYYMAKHFDDVLSVTKKQILDVVKKRNEVIRYLDKINLEYKQGTSTFYIFVSIEKAKLKSEEFCDILLDEKHICVVPGIGYGKSCDGFIRVSIGTEPLDRIFYALDEIKKLINKA